MVWCVPFGRPVRLRFKSIVSPILLYRGRQNGAKGGRQIGGVIFILLVCFLCSVSEVKAQEISGTIHYEDGAKQNFSDVISLKVFEDEKGMASRGVYVDYNNTVKKVTFSKISEIRVENFRLGNDGRDLIECTAIVRTKTGIETNTYCRVMNSIDVTIKDELTGRKKKQNIKFAEGGDINIRFINFD